MNKNAYPGHSITAMNKELFIKQISLFASLSQEACARLVQKLKAMDFQKGDVIVQEGDRGDSLFILESGLVKVVLGHGTDKPQVLARLRAGDYFGEMSLLTNEPRSATVIATVETKALVLQKYDLDELMKQYPSMALHFSRVLSKRLKATSRLKSDQESYAIVSIYSEDEDRITRTLLTMNLAASLVKETAKRVLMIDADGEARDVINALNLNLSAFSSRSLLDHYEEILDRGELDRFILPHTSGIDFVSVFNGSQSKSRIHEKDISTLLNILKLRYDYVLINCSNPLSVLIRGAMDNSDLIVYLTSTAPERLAKCMDTIQYFEDGLGYGGSKLMIGILEKDDNPPLTKDEISEKVKLNSIFFFAQDPYAVDSFLRTGRPFVFEYPNSNLSLGVKRLARKIGQISVGVALSSGSARGFAHVGVLKVLHNAGIPIDLIAGSSMGSFIGGFYAAGVMPQQLEEMVNSYTDRTKVRKTMYDLTVPRSGLAKGHSLSTMFRSEIGDITFDKLKIPFIAVATDLDSGMEVKLRKGILWQALRASGSIPIMFEPYYFDGRYLVDGGVTNPLPTDVLVDEGADIIISIVVNSVYATPPNPIVRVNPLGDSLILSIFNELKGEVSRSDKPERFNLLDVLFRTIGIMGAELIEPRAKLADVDIRPDLAHIDWREFHRGPELISAGEEAAEEALPAIQELLHEATKKD